MAKRRTSSGRRRSSSSGRIVSSAWRCVVAAVVLSISSSTKPSKWAAHPLSMSSSSSPPEAAAIRQAMELSRQAPANVGAAHRACQLWERILRDDQDDDIGDDSSTSPPRPQRRQRERILLSEQVRGLALALWASCLVRVGRDDDALVAYREALETSGDGGGGGTARGDLLIGSASSLQRLLRYDEAREVFLKASTAASPQSLERAVTGAALCSLRMGDADGALRALNQLSHERVQEKHSEVRAMWALTRYLARIDSFDVGARGVREDSGAFPPVYRWATAVLSATAKTKNPLIGAGSYSFTDLVRANIGAFDDPMLAHLDDKVLLHRLLSPDDDRAGSHGEFWPTGIVLPVSANESEKLEPLESSDEASYWICKRRSGYGSHGNAVVDKGGALAIASANFDSGDDENQQMLLQRMVDPPLLVQDRKFSLRIYVVYFGDTGDTDATPPGVYLSKAGLVKLAAQSFQDDDLSGAVHMTNSGREATMEQHDLGYLKAELAGRGFSYDRVWETIARAVREVFVQFRRLDGKIVEMQCQRNGVSCLELDQYRRRLATLGIPKILGFDIVLDDEAAPWLIEVNRFPGLEPRDETDAAVKRKVVRAAWRVAADRQGLDLPAGWSNSPIDKSITQDPLLQKLL